VRDAALISAAQRVEHYEMAAYGTVRTYAQLLGQPKVAKLLEETLEEEKAADQKLTSISQKVNAQAQQNA
jgi:ferritin-like metal-binding protein YciE